MSGRHRDIGRQFPSGSAKRKAKDEKEKRDSLVASKTRKVTDFFTGRSANAQVQPQTLNEERETDHESSESEHEYPVDPTFSQTSVASNVDDADTDNSPPSVNQIETERLQSDALLTSDLGTWPETINTKNQDFWIGKGSATCQNMDSDFASSQKSYKATNRFCSKSLFIHQHKLTKETTPRTWLCFSPSKASLFCFPCKVMNAKGNQFADGGFNDWRHAAERVQAHEQSLAHRNALIAMLNRGSEKQRVDSQLVEEVNSEREYWTRVLERIVAVITFIAERGLAFRGDDEVLGSMHNGNYLGILELLAKFDPFLQEHIKNYGQKGTGTTSYLSHRICDEFVALLAQEVEAKIIEELKSHKFFSVSVDSTPDVTHTD